MLYDGIIIVCKTEAGKNISKNISEVCKLEILDNSLITNFNDLKEAVLKKRNI